MKKSKIKLFAVILAASMLFTSPVLGDSTATDATVKSYEDRMADAKAKEEQAKLELERVRGEKSNAWEEISQYDALINLNTEKKNLAEAQYESLSKKIEAKKADIEATELRIEQQEQAFIDRVVAIYEEGNASYLEILLGAESLHDFLTRMDMLSFILENDKAIIESLKSDKQQLETDKEDLQKAMDDLVLVTAELESSIASTKQLYSMKEDMLKNLESDEKRLVDMVLYNQEIQSQINEELENYLAELAEKQRRAAELAEQQRRAAQAAADEAALKAAEAQLAQYQYVGGDLGWPLELGTYYTISSKFGGRMLWGVYDFHLGLDIACAMNTRILAANSGTVITSGWHDSYGNYVIVDHGGGITTLYAHMNERAVSVGETVSTGDVLGYVGMTGSASGYHVHFEVRENGSVTDPLNYIVCP